MPIIDEDKWKQWQENNQDGYGKFCVDVARTAFELLDNGFKLNKPEDGHKLICDASDKNGGGLSGFQAGAVGSMLSSCHSQGKFFQDNWKSIF